MSKADRVTLKDATAACKGRAALPRMSTCRRAGSRLGRWGSDTAHPPRPHRRREALRRHRAEVLVLKQTAGQAMRTLRDHHRARIGEAARFGVSPTTACSCAAPAPMRSPTTTGPGAMPMRTRSRSGAESCSTASTSGVVSAVPSLAAKSQNSPKVTPVTDEEPNDTCGFVRVTFASKQSIAAGGLPAPFAEGRPLGNKHG